MSAHWHIYNIEIPTNTNLLKVVCSFYQACNTVDGKEDGKYVRTIFGAIFVSLSDSAEV
jgi:hypothetical protein